MYSIQDDSENTHHRRRTTLSEINLEMINNEDEINVGVLLQEQEQQQRQLRQQESTRIAYLYNYIYQSSLLQQSNNNILPTLIMSVLLGLVSGTLYGFGRYAKTLKEVLSLSQSEVQTLGIWMDCGNYVGHPLTGLIYDRNGPITSCLVAAIIVFFSYWRIRYTLSLNQNNDNDDLSDSASLWLGLAFAGVGFGSGLGYISGLGSTTKALSTPSMQAYFGTGIGMVAAGYGMSSTVVGLTYTHSPDLPTFFLFWQRFVPAVNLCAAVMFWWQARNITSDETTEESLSSNPQMADPIVESLLTSSNLEENSEEPDLTPPTIDDAILGDEDGDIPQEATASLLSSSNLEENLEEPELAPTSDDAILGDEEDDIPHEATVSLNDNGWNSWKTPEFWLLFASFSCVTGCGLMVINNLSTMVESMGGSDRFATTLIIVLSMSNVSGRIVLGIVGDYSLSATRGAALHRIRLLQGVNLITAFAMLLGYLGGQRAICLAYLVILVAMAYGGSWVLIVALASNLFGKNHFGKDYGLLALGPALSGMIFNKASAKLYEEHVSSNDNVCLGSECYGTSYLAAGLVAMAGNLIAMVLYRIQLQKRQ